MAEYTVKVFRTVTEVAEFVVSTDNEDKVDVAAIEVAKKDLLGPVHVISWELEDESFEVEWD